MEIFVDFGLFEVLVGLGLAAASRAIFARRRVGILFLVWASLAPIAVVFTAQSELARWIGVAALASALVNVATIATLIRRHDLAALLTRAPATRPASGDR